MQTWGAGKFGDPCRECGFSWEISSQHALAIVAGTPARFRELTAAATGRERHPDLGWDVASYTSHVADNLRNWSERFVGATSEGVLHIPAFRVDAIADARLYATIPLSGALWSLERSVAGWLETARLVLDASLVFEHELRGTQPAHDIVLSNSHDAYHHAWDLTRILG
jgi:hypothetical protein